MAMHVVLLRGDQDQAAAALKAALPNLRWVASYRVHGAYDAVDIVDFQPGEDLDVARRALQDAGIEAEWLPAKASPSLRAPG